MRNTYLYGFATFGHPNDYRQSPFKFDSETIAKNVKIFDLPNAIKVFPNSTLYAIRKENAGGFPGVSYAIYTFAQEMNSKRDGTFIGSSILYTNEIADENITISKLNEFHTILTTSNTENDILKVNHSNDFTHSIEFLKDFDKVAYNLKPIKDLENFSFSNKHILVGSRTDLNTLTTHLKKALLLLNKFDTIFFTSSREIVDFCKNRNIYTVTDENGFELEIVKILNENKQKVVNSISEFENEKQKLEKDKQFVLSDLKNQIDRNKNIHKENERALKENDSYYETVNSIYSDFSNQLNLYTKLLNEGGKLENVRALYRSNKKIFIDGVSNGKRPKFFSSLNKVKSSSNLNIDNTQNEIKFIDQQTNNNYNEEGSRKRKIDVYKISTLIFAFLWIFSIVFILRLNNTKEVKSEFVSDQIPLQMEIVPKIDSISQPELNPKPNSSLNENDLKTLRKEGLKNKNAKEIVELIFQKNPTDIASFYNSQKNVYEKVLVAKNPNCFKDNLCISDSLIVIPSNKK